MAVTDAHAAHQLGHVLRGCHERVRGRLARELGVLDVVVLADAHGAGQVGAAVAVDLVAVDDADVRVVQVFLEPIGLNEDVGSGVAAGGHGAPPG